MDNQSINTETLIHKKWNVVTMHVKVEDSLKHAQRN